MDTMNIAVPETLKEFVQSQVAERGYSSVSEYIRELIRADQKEKAWAALETEVLKGIRSGKSKPMSEKDWAKLAARIGGRATRKN